MWAGRRELVGLRDALAVPEGVRRALHAVLPAREYTAYRVSDRRASVVSNADAAPYEMHVTFAAAVARPDVVRALAGSRDHGAAAAALPPGADPSLPACRVVGTDRGVMDVLFGEEAPTFPFLANVLTFSEEAVLAGRFDAPLCVAAGVQLHLRAGVTDGRRL